VLAALLPFFGVALVGALCAVWARRDVVPLADDGLLARAELFCHSLVFYLSKCAFPGELYHLYPAPEHMAVWSAEWLLPLLVTVAAAAVCWRLRRTWPKAVTAVVCYVLLLLPASALVRSGAQIVAARYSYLPLLPLCIAAAGGLWLLVRSRPRLLPVVTPAAAGVLLCLTVQARAQVGVWRDSESLWTSALRTGCPGEARAAYQLGRTQLNQGRYAEARALAERALARSPGFPEAEACLGIVYFRTGHYEKAEPLLIRAAENAPQEIDAACSLALLWAQRGRQQEALQCMERVRRTQPDQAHVYRTLGILQEWRKEAALAIQAYREALRLDARDYAVHHNLGQLLVGRGQLEEGLSHLQEAARLRPQVADLHYAVGRTLVQAGRQEEACAAFARTLDLCPGHARAERDRAAVLQRLAVSPTRERGTSPIQ
jgi:Flp pilus assembly protein TadD